MPPLLLQMKSKAKRIIAISISVVLLCCIIYAFKHRYYIAFSREMGLSVFQTSIVYGHPKDREHEFSIIIEAEKGHWDKVLELTEKNSKNEIVTYYHNLAKAMTGSLSDGFLNHYQPFERGLFLPITQGSTALPISCASEVWWQMGEMTLAEHATMLGMIFFQKDGAPRFYRRLAQIAHVNGDENSAAKYERLLGKPVSGWEEIVPLSVHSDSLVLAGEYRKALLAVLDSHPDNKMAYEYLLCYDLMVKDLDSFFEDYIPGSVDSSLYQEAILIYLASQGMISPETYQEALEMYSIPDKVFERFCSYTEASIDGSPEQLRSRFGNTYWFWFQFATRNE